MKRVIDGFERGVHFLTLLMVLVTFAVVVLRYGFDLGWIAMQESVSYLHAANFMLGAAFTLRHDAHVRVDIFYQKFGPRGRAWVDLLGTVLLLLPVCIFILVASRDYVREAWQLMEGSQEAGGIPAVWLLKSLLLAMPVLLILQGLAIAGRCLAIITGRATRPPAKDEVHDL